MRIVAINSVPNGSTGKIMLGIQNNARIRGHQIYTFVGNYTGDRKMPQTDWQFFGYRIENYIHAILGRLLGLVGFFSWFGTLSLIRKINKIKPDIVQLHNIHLWVVCYPMLLLYLKRKKILVAWTLHDCWSFTGHCPYFTLSNCEKWKTGCGSCPQLKRYPYAFIDNSRLHWSIKNKIFENFGGLSFITPSKWLADLARQSFLRSHNIITINNGIDLSVFTPSISNFRIQNHISDDTFVILGVAFDWEERKGLDVFLDLSKEFEHDNVSIILVGTNDSIDRILPQNVISIHKTNNQKELAEIYTAADVFVNPTREENYPTVNMESIACGTPVITFDTGGSAEMIFEGSGKVVKRNDVASLICELKAMHLKNDNSVSRCVEVAKGFDMNARFDKYVDFYESIV